MSFLKRMFYLDLRSLAVFRIGMAVLILCDLVIRSFYLKAHYTDYGVLPRSGMIDFTGFEEVFSLHLANGMIWFQVLLFLVAGFSAVMMLLGYKTRIFTVISWILLVSLQSRNFMIDSSADDLMRLALFWGMFLPLGKVYSWDSRGKEVSDYRYFALPAVGYFVQIACVYIFTVFLKYHPMWFEEFSALYFALGWVEFTTWVGVILFQFSILLKILTVGTLVVEFFSPFLWVMPFWRARLLGVLLILGLHLGIGTMMHVGIFPLVGIVTVLTFLPTKVWEFLGELRKRRMEKRPEIVVYYDDDCGMCQRFVNFVRIFWLVNNLKTVPIYENEEILKIANRENSWVVQVGEKQFLRGEGVIKLLKNSFVLAPLGWILDNRLVRWVSNLLYVPVARLRSSGCRIGEKSVVLRESLLEAGSIENSLRAGRFRNAVKSSMVALLLLVIVTTVFWNWWRLDDKNHRIPSSLAGIGKILRLDQAWAMFAPPAKKGGWIVMDGVLENEEKVDVWAIYSGRDGEISYEVPKNMYRTYISDRWHKYFENLRNSTNEDKRSYFSDFMCSYWNVEAPKGEKLIAFRLYYVTRELDYNYNYSEPVEEFIFADVCYEEEGLLEMNIKEEWSDENLKKYLEEVF